MKNVNRFILPTAACMIVALAAAPALAQVDKPTLTFGFTELDGDYNDNGDLTGSFTAQASSEARGGPFNTAGDVTRVFEPSGTANYDSGFLNLGTDADVFLGMDISGVTGSEAFGTGEFMIADANGDRITGNISGSWQRLGGNFGSFEGIASNVILHTDGNGKFEGPSGGAWGMNLPFGPVYSGAIIVLETGSWFTKSFTDTDTQVEAAFVPVPVPGAALLAAIGIGLVTRRRRLS